MWKYIITALLLLGIPTQESWLKSSTSNVTLRAQEHRFPEYSVPNEVYEYLQSRTKFPEAIFSFLCHKTRRFTDDWKEIAEEIVAHKHDNLTSNDEAITWVCKTFSENKDKLYVRSIWETTFAGTSVSGLSE